MHAVFGGARKRIEREHNGRAWQAWQTANLSRAKKLPKLATLLVGERPKRRQTIEEQEAIARRWEAKLAARDRQTRGTS